MYFVYLVPGRHKNLLHYSVLTKRLLFINEHLPTYDDIEDEDLLNVLVNGTGNELTVLVNTGVQEGPIALVGSLFDQTGGDDSNHHSVNTFAVN